MFYCPRGKKRPLTPGRKPPPSLFLSNPPTSSPTIREEQDASVTPEIEREHVHRVYETIADHWDRTRLVLTRLFLLSALNLSNVFGFLSVLTRLFYLLGPIATKERRPWKEGNAATFL